ncbi:MAG: hypothetical protein RI571_15085 [Roseovarius sp.]|nr:hypothetical protein [Roseovarius sp.]
MTRSIILHVGSPKCGSTYLQYVMQQNAGRLLAQGIRYPDAPGTHPGNAADLADITAAQVAAMFEDGVHTAVLSHEDLYSLPKRGRALAAIAAEAGIAVQPLAFLRPFSDFVFGDYSQFMKQHFETFLAERKPYGGRDFAAFAQRRIDGMKPAAYLRNWGKLFPDRPVVLDNARNIRPVLERLLDHPEGLDWEVAAHRTNPSLRMEDCDRIAAAMRDPDRTDREIRKMFRDAFHNTGDPDAGRSAERIAWLETQFEPQNAALLEEFGFDNRRPADPDGG